MLYGKFNLFYSRGIYIKLVHSQYPLTISYFTSFGFYELLICDSPVDKTPIDLVTAYFMHVRVAIRNNSLFLLNATSPMYK
jgi:hypothetical protein